MFDAATPMVYSSDRYSKKGKVIDSTKRIIDPKTNSFYRAISSESKTKHGFNAHGVIFDELHVQPNRDLWDVLTTSGGTREQPLTVAITTAGWDKESICYEQHLYTLKVISGVHKDPTFYGVIYAADEEDDWTDEKVWYKANPALGDFRSLEEMRTLFNKAQEVIALQNTFKNLYLNIWTEQETRWMAIEKWDACNGYVGLTKLKKQVCYCGLDLSTTTDLSAFVMMFLIEGIWKVVPLFFLPEDCMHERVRRDKVRYDVWAEQGYITLTPGNVIDYKFIEDTIYQHAERYEIESIGYDPYNATEITQRIADEGIQMVDVRQGMASMSAPSKQLETWILQKKIHHGGNPVLRWMFNNVMMKKDANANMKPDKEKSIEKIDGIIALIIAVSQAMLGLDSRSVYQHQGIKMV